MRCRDKRSTVSFLRRWFHAALISVLALLTIMPVSAKGQSVSEQTVSSFTIRKLTSGPKQHFFGYYGINPWNESGEYLLCLETDFQDRAPLPDEPAGVCLVDAKTGETTRVAETRAWNFQQGAMLHWDPRNPEHGILYNDRDGDSIISVSLDTRTGEKKLLPRAISAVSHDGRYALSLTYGRLQRLRPVVGYTGVRDPNPTTPNPDDDGVFLMDLATGETRLVVSIARVYDILVEKHPELEGYHMWFNHTVFSPDDTRFLFLARARVGKLGRKSAMLTANVDGSDLREVVPWGKGVSHFDWRNEKEIIATFRLADDVMNHVLFTDGQTDYRILAPDFLVGDGHCTFGPDRNWLVTDPRVPRRRSSRRLQLYNVETGDTVEVGEFRLGKYTSGDRRCDLHPRWKPTGDAICFDAIAPTSGTRQLHVAEIRWP